MFDKFKQLNELRKLQNAIKEQRAEAERDGVKVVLRGDFEVMSVSLNPALDIRAQERAIMTALNDARTKLQRILTQNFSGKFPM